MQIVGVDPYGSILGGGNEVYLVKFSSTGTRLWGTYFGDVGNEDNYHGLNVDLSGNVYLAYNKSGTVLKVQLV